MEYIHRILCAEMLSAPTKVAPQQLVDHVLSLFLKDAERREPAFGQREVTAARKLKAELEHYDEASAIYHQAIAIDDDEADDDDNHDSKDEGAGDFLVFLAKHLKGGR